MISFFRSRYFMDRCFLLTTAFIAAAALGILIFFVISLFSFHEMQLQKVEAPRFSQKWDKNQILNGPLALKENTLSPLVLSLQQKLVLLAQSVRPDMQKGEKAFRIGVKGSEEQRVVKEGEAIFCTVKQHPSGGVENLAFVNEPTDISLVPHVLDARSLLLTIQQTAKDSTEIILQAALQEQKESGPQDGISALQGAKWWGLDLFYREYGGEKFQTLAQKHKIEFLEGKDHYLLYVKAGDYLTFQEGKWHTIDSLEGAGRNNSLAHVVSMGQNLLEIEAWDASGFSLLHKKWELEKPTPCRVAMEQLIADAKLRTANQVTCKIGKKRWILRPGDWLMKTQTGWHKLKTSQEIDAYLNHEVLGELFVVDSVNMSGKMQGNYFDEMRVQMHPFSLQVSSSKSNKKKKNASVKK